MKVVLNLVKFILTIILTLFIIAFVFANIISSTILNKQFILSQLDNTNYYANTYTAVTEDFKNYIYKSGLNETVLNNIVSQEKVRQDTITIINNIYDGTNTAIDTTEIATNLNNNINASLQGDINQTQQMAIDSFVEKITEQYKDTMSHTNYEDTINKYFSKITSAVDLLMRVSAIGMGAMAILLIVISLKDILNGLSFIAAAVSATGLFNIFINAIVNAKVKIQNITILNDSISITLREILTNVMNTINKYGIILLAVGLVIIIICSIIKARQKIKEEQ